jgi:hypothetical protein
MALDIPRQMIRFHEHCAQVWSTGVVSANSKSILAKIESVAPHGTRKDMRLTPRTNAMLLDLISSASTPKQDQYIGILSGIAGSVHSHMCESLAAYPTSSPIISRSGGAQSDSLLAFIFDTDMLSITPKSDTFASDIAEIKINSSRYGSDLTPINEQQCVRPATTSSQGSQDT